MGYNFNNYSNEYSLHNSVTSELINLYGFETTYIKTTKVNIDNIFGDITNLRADNNAVYRVSVYPENSASFDNQNDLLSKFGILSFDSINLFISHTNLLSIHSDEQVQRAIGDLIVLPSGKIMEITDLDAQVPGINNMFVYNNQKNVYLLKCKPYNYNHDELNVTSIPDLPGVPDFGALFDLADKAAEQTAQNVQSDVVKNIDDVFGDLG